MKHILKLKTDAQGIDQITICRTDSGDCLVESFTGEVINLFGTYGRLTETFLYDHVIETADGIKLSKFKNVKSEGGNVFEALYVEYYYNKVKELNSAYAYPPNIEVAYNDYMLYKEYKRTGKVVLPSSEIFVKGGK